MNSTDIGAGVNVIGDGVTFTLVGLAVSEIEDKFVSPNCSRFFHEVNANCSSSIASTHQLVFRWALLSLQWVKLKHSDLSMDCIGQ